MNSNIKKDKGSNIISRSRELKTEYERWDSQRVTAFDEQSIIKGKQLSRLVLTAPDTLYPTPWFKRMMDEIDGKSKTSPEDDTTKAELYVDKLVERIMISVLGATQAQINEREITYDYSLRVDDYSHYIIDCLRNWKKGDQSRHLYKGINDHKIGKVFDPFQQFPSSLNLEEISYLPEAVEIVSQSLPHTKISNEIKTVSAPFSNKDANVGYPYFVNDRRIEPKTGLTYGQYILNKAIKGDYNPLDASYYPYVAFARYMRGKIRPIIGSSRIFNILSNRVTAPMIEAYKNTSFFTGYNPPDMLKAKMIQLKDIVDKLNERDIKLNRTWFVENRDYSNYDTTISRDLRLLALAMNEYLLDYDDNALAQLKLTTFSALHAKLIITDKVKDIYGRILSGELLTNLDGSKINAIITISVLLNLNPELKIEIPNILAKYNNGWYFMGDDNLTLDYVQGNDTIPERNKRFSEVASRLFKVKVHPDKGEFGLFFLQRRLINKRGKLVLIAPFTRIIRSLMWREKAVGLGPAGWILMAWSLLYQLIEWPDLMLEVARIFIGYDKYRLGADLSLSQLFAMLKEEDSKATARGAQTSKHKLNDGDPLKAQFMDEVDREDKDGYLSKIHRLIRTLR